MPQRGPWICNALSTLVQPEFNPHKNSHAAHGPSAVQTIALDRIHHALSIAGAPDASLTPDGCLRDMLKGQSLYGEMPNNLATYDRSKLRVLSSSLKPQPLIDRLPKHARALYSRFSTFVEKSESQIAREQNSDSYVPVTPYWDPILKNNKRERRSLLIALAKVGLIGFRLKIRSRVGIFFVKKKDPGAIRMIIDARLTNMMHHRPPVTKLASSSCYVDLDLSDEAFTTSFKDH